MDDLLRVAGLSRDDFYGLRNVEQSEFSGRIVVTTAQSFEPHPVERRQPSNLVGMASLEGEQRFFFNPVE